MPSNIIQWLHQKYGLKESYLEELWSTNPKDLYHRYEIRSCRGHRRRLIEEPIPELKEVQRTLLPLFEEFPLHQACMSRRGRSFVENAAAHEGAKHILKVDIRKCFSSTTDAHLWSSLDSINTDQYLLWISGLHFCLISGKQPNLPRVLPTGAPTSPILCNIALTPLDYQIEALVKPFGYTYTRYMDDLTISTKDKDRIWTLLNGIEMLIRSEDYKVNRKKTKWLMTKAGNEKVIVTGVRMGRGSKVPKEFRKMLRAKLQNLAMEEKDLDPEAIGCLAYVKSIDEGKYSQFLSYYEKRRQYGLKSDL